MLQRREVQVRLIVGHCNSKVQRNYDEAAHSEPAENGCVLAIERTGALEGVVTRDDLEAGSSGDDGDHKRNNSQLSELVAVEDRRKKA